MLLCMVVAIIPKDLILGLRSLLRKEAKRNWEELQHLPQVMHQQVEIDIGSVPFPNTTPVEPYKPIAGKGLDFLRAQGNTTINGLKDDPEVVKPIGGVDLEDHCQELRILEGIPDAVSGGRGPIFASQDPVQLELQDGIELLKHLIFPHFPDSLVVLSHRLPILQVSVACTLFEPAQDLAFTVKVGDAKLEDVGRIGEELGEEKEAQFGSRSSTTRTGPIPNGL